MLLRLLLSRGLVLLILLIHYIVKFEAGPRTRKATPFECGFEALTLIRRPFSLRYYVLVVLFLVFDVEAVLLFPCLANLINGAHLTMLLNIFGFLVLLLGGLIYEYNNNILD